MKKIFSVLVLSLLFISWNQNQAFAEYDSSSTEEQSESPDWKLTMKVKAAILGDDSLSPGNRFVSVSTTDGIVTITGKVSDKYQMHEIVKTAESVEGVKKVENQMTISD